MTKKNPLSNFKFSICNPSQKESDSEEEKEIKYFKGSRNKKEEGKYSSQSINIQINDVLGKSKSDLIAKKVEQSAFAEPQFDSRPDGELKLIQDLIKGIERECIVCTDLVSFSENVSCSMPTCRAIFHKQGIERGLKTKLAGPNGRK